MQNEAPPLIETAPDQQELFGGEESYWTVFRMFASNGYVGHFWNMEDVWDRLSKNYDMTDEDSGTIHQTLMEWASDLEADALEKFGIQGTFVYQNKQYVFAEKWRPSLIDDMKREVLAKNKASIALKNTVRRPVEIVETEPVQVDVTELVLATLKDNEQGMMKQADVKRSVVAAGYDGDFDDLQEYIDAFVENGTLFKARRGAIQYLSLSPLEEKVPAQQQATERNSGVEQLLDTPTAVAILEALCAPGTHYSQRLTMSELWRRMNDTANRSQAIPADELDILKKASRQLQSLGLVTAGGEKIGTGGSVRTNAATSSKRRRSASQHVYKVGLTSQQVKKNVQNALTDGDIRSFLADIQVNSSIGV